MHSKEIKAGFERNCVNFSEIVISLTALLLCTFINVERDQTIQYYDLDLICKCPDNHSASLL